MFVRVILRGFGFLSIFFLLSFLYLRHFDDIGKLPAESVEYSAADSRVRSVEKEPIALGGCRSLVLQSARKDGGTTAIQIFGPSIPLVKVDQNLLDLVDVSSGFLVHDGRLYAVDDISASAENDYKFKGNIQGGVLEGSLSHINNPRFVHEIKRDISFVRTQLIQQGYVTQSSINSLGDKSKAYFLRCPNLSNKDKLGVTEYFWAAEGRSVLHHWAHFYEGGVFGSVMKAQYGAIIPFLTQLISSKLPNDGPSSNISVAWILFYLSALIYCALLFLIFKDYPFTVIFALLIKIILFINLREFIIFLAPGAHWFRELNFLLIYIISSFFIFTNKRSRYFGIPLLLLFIFTLLFDPMSGAFGWAAVIFSYGLSIYKTNSIKINRNGVVASLIVFFIFMAILFLYSNNVYYFLSMIKNNIFSANLSNQAVRYIILNGIFLGIVGLLYLNSKLEYKYLYFSFLGNISIIYYLMTPDWVHYYKFLEYAILLYMCIFIIFYIFYNKYITYVKNLPWFKKNLIDRINYKSIVFIKILVLTIIFINIISQLLNLEKINSKSPLTTLYGADNKIFFNASDFIVSNKKLVSNISKELASHLESYPAGIGQDFIISNFDKYILFLYNSKNNFGFIDLRSQMINDKEMKKIIFFIKNNDGKYVVDKKNFQIDLAYGPKISGDPILIQGDGEYYLGPYNYIKSQLRMAIISRYIMNNCIKNDQQTNENWFVFHCGVHSKGSLQ